MKSFSLKNISADDNKDIAYNSSNWNGNFQSLNEKVFFPNFNTTRKKLINTTLKIKHQRCAAIHRCKIRINYIFNSKTTNIFNKIPCSIKKKLFFFQKL